MIYKFHKTQKHTQIGAETRLEGCDGSSQKNGHSAATFVALCWTITDGRCQAHHFKPTFFDSTSLKEKSLAIPAATRTHEFFTDSHVSHAVDYGDGGFRRPTA
jgi:hypothetical protein